LSEPDAEGVGPLENVPPDPRLTRSPSISARLLEGCETGRAADVQQSEQLQLVINLKTADALHLAIPLTLRAPRQ
jgi:hypothetical protein